MAETQKDINYIKNTISKLDCKLDTFINTAEKKFAPMWVASVMTWGAKIIGSAILLAILGLILAKH